MNGHIISYVGYIYIHMGYLRHLLTGMHPSSGAIEPAKMGYLVVVFFFGWLT